MDSADSWALALSLQRGWANTKHCGAGEAEDSRAGLKLLHTAFEEYGGRLPHMLLSTRAYHGAILKEFKTGRLRALHHWRRQ
jgi:hypothetical protein